MTREAGDDRPALLFVTHDWGGGTERYVRGIAPRLEGEGVPVWVLRRGGPDAVRLARFDREGSGARFRPSRDRTALLTALRAAGIAHVHVAHLIGLGPWIDDLPEELGVGFDVTVCDHYFICPRVHCMDEHGRYCGEPDLEGCDACLRRLGGLEQTISGRHIGRWRARFERLLSRARRVFLLSPEMEQRIRRHFPRIAFTVRRPEDSTEDARLVAVTHSEGDVVRVALIGRVPLHKGAVVLRELARDALARRLALEFHVVGALEGETNAAPLENLHVTGEFPDGTLYDLLEERRCHLALFLSLVPETHGYTLTTAFAGGFHVIGYDLGAIGERIRTAGRGEVLPLDTPPGGVNDRLIAAARRLAAGPPPPPFETTRYASILFDHYQFEAWPPLSSACAMWIGAPPLPPLVTVVIPSHDHGRFLDECIRSVLEQDYPSVELLVIDDGSTDDSVDVIARYDDALRWFTQENVGEIGTVNRGLSTARGDYVVVLGDDDTLLPGMIRRSVEFMEGRRDLLMCYPDFVLIDERSVVFGAPQCRDFDYETMVEKWACLPGPGAFLRRRALDLVPGRDPRFQNVGDMDHWLRLGLHGGIARLPEILATHRVHRGSKQVYEPEAVADQILALARDYFRRAEIPPAIRALKARAMGSAWFEAAMRSPPGHRRRRYGLVRSLLADPERSSRRLVRDLDPRDDLRLVRLGRWISKRTSSRSA